MNKLYRRIKEYLRRHRNSSVLRRSLAALACVVVFVTTYLMIYPAITLEKNAVCGQTKHSHSETCYEKVLVCGREEMPGHTHTDACYEKAEELACSLEEHTHEDACYDENGELICGKSEHVHGADCYQEVRTLSCEQAESEGHVHTESCYERKLTCGLQEHTHNVSCYGPSEETAAVESKDHVSETAGAADEKGNTETSGTAGADAASEAAENETESRYGCMESEIALANDAFKQIFTGKTGLWVYSADGTWSMTGEQTQILPDTDVTVRLGFRLPRGTAEKPAVHLIYELPKEIRITNAIAKKVNDDANGYNSVILGTRVPGEELGEEETEVPAGRYTLKHRRLDKEERKAGDPEEVWFLDLVLNNDAMERNQEEALDAWLIFPVKGEDLAADKNGAGEVVFADDKEKHDGEKALRSKYHLSDSADVSDEEETGETAEVTAEEETGDTADVAAVEETGDAAAVTAEEKFPAQTFHAVSDSMIVDVTAEEGTFPAGTTMSVTDIAEEDLGDAVKEAAADAVDGNKTVKQVQAVDITFCDAEGNPIEPAKPVKVFMNPVEQTVPEGAETVVVHVKDDGSAEAMDVLSDEAAAEAAKQFTETAEKEARGDQQVFFSEAKEDENPAPAENAVAFEAEKFSVYAIVYTVDFQWEVNGEEYEFSIPGGGFISFYDLVKTLEIETDDADTETDEIQELVDGVESIVFSNPELVSVSKVEENTTIGAIKEHLSLECEYSAELTEKEIAEINAQEAKGGDWALIALKPFASEETLTVTMKNGEVWAVKVTDAIVNDAADIVSGNT